jgi:hypothetical protein
VLPELRFAGIGGLFCASRVVPMEKQASGALPGICLEMRKGQLLSDAMGDPGLNR